MTETPALTRLLSPEGQQLLNSLPPYVESESLAVGESLRKAGIDPELAAALLTQSKLRAKAELKFGELAQQLLFTASGLEQASRMLVAEQHAQRYVAAGCRQVLDMTCGIGADALALAQAGMQVTACDIDPDTVEVARFNLRSLPNAQVVCGDGLATARAGQYDGAFADPARRTTVGAKAVGRNAKGSAQRIFDPSDYLPPLDQVLAIRSAIPALGIKLGPGIPHEVVPEDAEAQWVSVNGEVVECALWFGSLAQNSIGHTALLMRMHDDGQVHTRLVKRDPQPPLPQAAYRDHGIPVGPVGEYLFEPDKAVIRAGLLDVAAAELGAHQIDPTIAYLTSDQLPSDPQAELPLATAYRVLDVMPYHLKKLKAYLRGRNVGRVTIKKRGFNLTPEQLRPQLALRGSNEATLVLTRIAGQHSVIVAEPLRYPHLGGYCGSRFSNGAAIPNWVVEQ